MDEETLYCAICHYLLIDCVETPCCGVGYCRACIESYLNSCLIRNCPSCRSTKLTIASLRTNKLAQRIVDNYPVECINKSNGCNAKIVWGIKQAHEELCDYSEFECIYNPTKCGKIFRKDIDEHEDKLCEWRCIYDPEKDHCYRHDKSFSFLCEDCDIYICIECYEQKHVSHNILPLSIAKVASQIKWLNCGINEIKNDIITSPVSSPIEFIPTITSCQQIASLIETELEKLTVPQQPIIVDINEKN